MSNKMEQRIVPDACELAQHINDYLTDDAVNTVFILSADVYEMYKTDSTFCEQLDKADLLLPSNSLMMKDFLRKNENFDDSDMDKYDYNAFDEIMKVVAKESHSVFILAQDENEMQQCKKSIEIDEPEIESQELCVSDIDEQGDSVLNEINAIAPDLLICSLDSPKQEDWILCNKDKMNVKMVLGIGPGIHKVKKNKVSLIEILKSIIKK